MTSPMTRRRFLNAVGLAGGSSAVFGAMDALGMMGQPARPRPQWTVAERKASVIVLGAGLSGLTVAYELGKLGYDVEVLEARGRVGGVVHTIRRGTTELETTGERQVCNFDEGLYLNGATWRIPNSHTPTLGYCKELGVPLQVFVNDNDGAYGYFEGDEYGELSGKRLRIGEINGDLRGRTDELFAKVLDPTVLDLPFTTEDYERLLAYLIADGPLSTDRLYTGGPNTEREPAALLTLLRSGVWNRRRSNVSMVAPMFQPIGGIDRIPAAFARALGESITLNAEVESVRQNDDGVSVAYRNTQTGERSQISADYLVSCLPLSVLRGLDVPLSPDIARAVKSVAYSDTAKIGLQAKRRFWEDDDGIYGGIAATNLPIGTFAYPSHDYLSEKGVLLGFYGSETVEGLGAKSIEERIRFAVDQASKFHPQLATEFETGYAVFWNKIKYSNGGFATGERDVAALSHPDGRIYLGCAALGTLPTWMTGAFEAAWGTVERLHSRVAAG